jgi:hypothetical protein
MSARKLLALACLAAFGVLLVVGARLREPPVPRAFPERLLGPVASLVASAQWVRADLALREGRFELFCERAERALSIADDDPQAWIFFAHQLLFSRTSLERAGSAAERAAWFEAGLEVLRRGAERARGSAEIHLYEGGVWSAVAAMDEGIRPWRGTREQALARSIACFQRAAAEGSRLAAELAQRVQERMRAGDGGLDR